MKTDILILGGGLTGICAAWEIIKNSEAQVDLLGWGGGSPTGARLMAMCPALTRRQQIRLAVSCATMSPMFLLGTIGGWLGSAAAGAVCLISTITGGYLAGIVACFCAGVSNPELRIPN